MTAERGSLTRYCLLVTWLSYGLMLGSQLADSALQQLPASIYVIRLTPLLIFLPGMYADRLRSFIWLCFVCLLYFMAWVERLFASPSEAVSIVGMVAVVALFISSMMYVRWRARELKEEGKHA